MTSADLIMQEKYLSALRGHLVQSDGKEHAAYVLYGVSRIGQDPFSGLPRLRLTVREVLAVEDTEIRSSGPDHISWKTARFVNLLARAEREGVQLGIAHSHPGGPCAFSVQDDGNEAELARLAANRNGEKTLTVSLLFCGDRSLIGRVWLSSTESVELDSISTVSPRWQRFSRQQPTVELPAFNRQALALGPDFNATMRRLRIGVVGAGGTGSPLIQQLARMGVGRLAVFDPDIVEASNLNRLHGATAEDARAGRKKVDVARREVERMGLGTEVATFNDWIGSDACRDALKSMDIIFGCTDDHEGRSLLNRLAYYYLIPVIDVGLALRVVQRDGQGLLEAEGRVTVLEPGASCLLCRRIVNPSIAAEEALKRNDPEEYDRRKSEAYVRGEGDPAPAVVSFTTSVATMAIEEMIQRLVQFRGSGGDVANRVRKFTRLEDVRPGAASDHCRICGRAHVHGAADVTPFLGRIG